MGTAGSPRRRLVLAYDGAAYSGWQVQPGRRTVQGEVEAALARILLGAGAGAGARVRVEGSGRTDAGVHALGQVAHFDDPLGMDGARLLASLNALLPPDIRARDLAEAPAAFHARHDALRKTYVYQLHLVPGAAGRRAVAAGMPPHRRRLFHGVPGDLDLATMRRAARALLGRRDFTALSRSMDPSRSAVRTLRCLRVLRAPDGLRIFASADGFLYGMVRMISGLLVEVGLGRRAVQDVPALLAAADRSRAPPSLPPHALFLARVRYAPGAAGGRGAAAGRLLC